MIETSMTTSWAHTTMRRDPRTWRSPFDRGPREGSPVNHRNHTRPLGRGSVKRRLGRSPLSSIRYSTAVGSLPALKQRLLPSQLFMLSFLIQLVSPTLRPDRPLDRSNPTGPANKPVPNRAQFALSLAGIATSVTSRHQLRPETLAENPMRYAWASSGAVNELSRLIPSARYVYSSPALSPLQRDEGQSKREKIFSLHSQLNQLKRELDAELNSQEDAAPASLAPGAHHQTPPAAATQPTDLLDAKSAPLPPQVSLGSPCLSSSFCNRSIKNSQCNTESFTCVCQHEHVQFNATSCLARKSLPVGAFEKAW